MRAAVFNAAFILIALFHLAAIKTSLSATSTFSPHRALWRMSCLLQLPDVTGQVPALPLGRCTG